MHREQVDDNDAASIASHKPRLLLKDPTSEAFESTPRYSNRSSTASDVRLNGKLEGVYQHVSCRRDLPWIMRC